MKLLLSMLLVAKWPPHSTDFKASAWARLLGLNDPQKNGARAISDAITALEEAGLLHVERRRGWPPVCTLLRETGEGVPYVRPGPAGPDHSLYFPVPIEFWTSGWAVTLNGPALTAFLVMLDQRGFPRTNQPFWISPRNRAELYDVSEDTLYDGMSTLSQLGLVRVSRMPQQETFDPTRLRNRYTPAWERLALTPPCDPPPPLESGPDS